MRRRFLCLFWAAFSMWEGVAWANGRPPFELSVAFEPKSKGSIYVAATFGFLVSLDGGMSFHWLCESATGFTGTADPHMAIALGRAWIGLPNGLRVSRDNACTWDQVSLPSGNPPIGALAIGMDGRVWTATAKTTPGNDIFVAPANSESFTATGPSDDVMWSSIALSVSDPNRVYAAGVLTSNVDTAVLRRSIDGGRTWQPLPVASFTLKKPVALEVLGVSPANADVVFAVVRGSGARPGDDLYRSMDGGMSFSQVLSFADKISGFVARPDGKTVLAGTIFRCPEDQGDPMKGCLKRSIDGGLTWQAAKAQPHVNCLGQNPDGDLFSCGNSGSDKFALGRSTDNGDSFTPIFSFQDVTTPLACPAGTQQSFCSMMEWPSVCGTILCSLASGNPGGTVPPSGCQSCSTTGAEGGGLAVLVGLALFAARRRLGANGSSRT